MNDEQSITFTQQELRVLLDILNKYSISISVSDLSKIQKQEIQSPLLTIFDKLTESQGS
jgi:hypothetical protein